MILCIGSQKGWHMHNMKIGLGFKSNFEVKKSQHVFETEKSHFIKQDTADQNKLERDLDLQLRCFESGLSVPRAGDSALHPGQRV